MSPLGNRVGLFALAFVLAACNLRGQGAPEPSDAAKPYRILQTITLGGDGGWDCLTMDAQTRRLFIARATRVMVVNIDSGKLVGEIPGNGVHAVAVVPATNRGFITNGKDDTVTMFDLKTLAVLGKIPVGKKPDIILFDPASNRVFVCNNGSTDLTALAPADGAVQGTVEVGGAPEFAVADGKGHLFVNLEDKSEVVAFDGATLAVTAHWPLQGKQPTGLAMDREHRRLFSGCRATKTLEVLNADTGKTLASLPIGAGVDGTGYDPTSGMAFSSNGDATLTIVHEDTPDTFRVAQTLPTKAGARTMAIDEQTHHVLLAAAERQVAPGAGPDAARKAPIVPGTFAILVVGR